LISTVQTVLLPFVMYFGEQYVSLAIFIFISCV
jgi:hypothetical protein